MLFQHIKDKNKKNCNKYKVINRSSVKKKMSK